MLTRRTTRPALAVAALTASLTVLSTGAVAAPLQPAVVAHAARAKARLMPPHTTIYQDKSDPALYRLTTKILRRYPNGGLVVALSIGSHEKRAGVGSLKVTEAHGVQTYTWTHPRTKEVKYIFTDRNDNSTTMSSPVFEQHATGGHFVSTPTNKRILSFTVIIGKKR